MSIGNITFDKHSRAIIVRVMGEVDMSNARDMASAITAAVTNDLLGLVVDLSAVDYLDSAGIHLLFRLREATRSRGQQMRLVVPDGSPVRDALRLAGVRNLVETHAGVDAALQALPGV